MQTLTPYTDSLPEKEPAGTLVLTVKEPWFSLMMRENDRKDFEVRRPSKWILSRLINRNGESRKYKYIKIINGYGSHRPYFIAEYNGFGTGYLQRHVFQINGKTHELNITTDQYMIFLGTITKRKI